MTKEQMRSAVMRQLAKDGVEKRKRTMTTKQLFDWYSAKRKGKKKAAK